MTTAIDDDLWSAVGDPTRRRMLDLLLASGATQALVSSLGAPPRPGTDLSEREQTVLRLMTRGLSNDQIADQLYISRNTVRHHVHNILTKLGVANRTEAVSLAFQHSLTA